MALTILEKKFQLKILKVFEFFIKNDLDQVDTAEGYGVNWNNLKSLILKLILKL